MKEFIKDFWWLLLITAVLFGLALVLIFADIALLTTGFYTIFARIVGSILLILTSILVTAIAFI